MSRLFGRRWKLQVGTRSWDGLRVVFSVDRSLTKAPNPASISVYNLSDASRGLLSDKGVTVQLSAGYEDTAEVLFTGTLRRAQHRKDGADIVSEIFAADGQAAWNSTVNAVVGGDRALRDVVRDLATAMGLKVQPSTLAAISGTTRGGTVLRGYAHRDLDILLRSAGYEWSVQDEALQVLRSGAALATDAVKLDEDTGLVGWPEPLEKGKGYTAVSLLQPRIQPGRSVVLRSRVAEGVFRVRRVTHAGDTHSPSNWTSTAELVPTA